MGRIFPTHIRHIRRTKNEQWLVLQEVCLAMRGGGDSGNQSVGCGVWGGAVWVAPVEKSSRSVEGFARGRV